MPSATPPTVSDLAQLRRAAVRQAATAWESAPAHVRVLASQYVRPLLDVLQAMSAEQDARDLAAAVAEAARNNRDGRAL